MANPDDAGVQNDVVRIAAIVFDPAERSQTYTACGSIFDADVNAAKNILNLGISPTGGLLWMARESSRTTGRKQRKDLECGSSAFQGREQSSWLILGKTVEY